MRTGTANLPLHGGKCPPWLFAHMKELAPAVIRAITYEYGAGEVLRRLADPVWFQAFGCLLGFDWHASGVTTTVCGAIKEGLKPYQGELGIFVAGGKGRTSRKTPLEIDAYGDKYGLPNELQGLKYASRMAAKVDSAALQDGYQLYHHLFVFTADGKWTVIQQGMNTGNRFARRYHWLSEELTGASKIPGRGFVSEPHSAICGDTKATALNLVAGESADTRQAVAELAREKPEAVLKHLRRLEAAAQSRRTGQLSFSFADGGMSDKADEAADLAADYLALLEHPGARSLSLPACHPIPNSDRMNRLLAEVYERQPENFETLLALPGVGEGALRALTMVAEVVHGVRASYRDPVRYSFAHGGKDGFPFPVNRETYTSSITSLETALAKAKVGDQTRMKALKRLAAYADHIRIRPNTNQGLAKIEH